MNKIFKNYVIDASMGVSGDMFCFCPIEGDIDDEFNVITGMNILSNRIPEGVELVAIVHPDGNEAVKKFCDKYSKELEEI